MRVRVLYFGVLREILGRSEDPMELDEGASVEELLRILKGRTSKESMANDRTWQCLAVAVNREYRSAETVLRGGDEVALLPPVSGGCVAHAGTPPPLGAMRTGRAELCWQRSLPERAR